MIPAQPDWRVRIEKTLKGGEAQTIVAHVVAWVDADGGGTLFPMVRNSDATCVVLARKVGRVLEIIEPGSPAFSQPTPR
jgi:hypothetical protein